MIDGIVVTVVILCGLILCMYKYLYKKQSKGAKIYV